jgi:phosphodiester glycosidase
MKLQRLTFAWLSLFFFALPRSGATQGPPGAGHRFKNSPALAIADAGSWRAVQNGGEFRKVTLERRDPYQIVDLKLFRFDSRWIFPRIVRSQTYNLKSANVKTLAEKSGAVAMINANYFDGNGKPLGYLKVLGEEVNPNISKSDLFTGIFAIKDRLAFIVHRDHFVPAEADGGLQAGPLLLAKGAALTVTRGAERQFRRSLIGIDSAQRVILAVTDTLFGGLTWVELQEFFGSAEWRAQTSDLLNLDGGGSTQVHVRGTQFEDYVAGTVEVPVAIGFFPAK